MPSSDHIDDQAVASGYRKVVLTFAALLLGGFIASYGALWQLAIANVAVNTQQTSDLVKQSEVVTKIDTRMERMECQLSEMKVQLGNLATDVGWIRSKSTK